MLATSALKVLQPVGQILLMVAYALQVFIVLRAHPFPNLVTLEHTTMQVVKQHARTVHQVFTVVATLQLLWNVHLASTVLLTHLMPILMNALKGPSTAWLGDPHLMTVCLALLVITVIKEVSFE